MRMETIFRRLVLVNWLALAITGAFFPHLELIVYYKIYVIRHVYVE